MSAVRVLSLSSCLLSLSAVSAGPEVQRVVVEEGSDVMLPCSLSTKQNIQSALFDWKKAGGIAEREVFLYDKRDVYSSQSGQSDLFKGRVSHFPGELKNGNASITITNTELSHSGNYTCEFPRLQPPHIFHVELLVGAAPEPSITILNATQSWFLLQCKVSCVSPQPRLQWKDSDGNVLPADEAQVPERGGGCYDAILKTTVRKTGRYRCVVTQEGINHQRDAETFVSICGSTGWIVVAVVLFLLLVGLVVVLAVLRFRGFLMLDCSKETKPGMKTDPESSVFRLN